MSSKFHSRKLFVALLLELLTTTLLVLGYVDQSVWENVTMLVGGSYLASQAYVDKRKRSKTETDDDYWESLDK